MKKVATLIHSTCSAQKNNPSIHHTLIHYTPHTYTPHTYTPHTKKTAIQRSFCDPCRIQTCNPHIRSVVLYSVELTDHCFSKAGAKVLLFFDMTKFFNKKVQNNRILLLFVLSIIQLHSLFLFHLSVFTFHLSPFSSPHAELYSTEFLTPALLFHTNQTDIHV